MTPFMRKEIIRARDETIIQIANITKRKYLRFLATAHKVGWKKTIRAFAVIGLVIAGIAAFSEAGYADDSILSSIGNGISNMFSPDSGTQNSQNGNGVAGNGQGTAMSDADFAGSSTCHICAFVNDLGNQSDSYGLKVYQGVAQSTLKLWKTLLTIGILWAALMAIMAGKMDVKSIYLNAFSAIIITFMLSHSAGSGATNGLATAGSGPAFWNIVYLPLRTDSIQFAVSMVSGSSGVTIPSADFHGNQLNPYAQLVGAMENAMMGVVMAGWKAISLAGAGANQGVIDHLKNMGSSFAGSIEGMLLMIPYMVVVGVFIAYVIESMFMFLGVICVSPVIIMLFYFEKGRAFLWIGMRIMLGAGLTLVFAGVAMGFTMFSVTNYEKALLPVIEVNPAAIITTWEYWICFFIGFCSILLHIKAKTLATNFSGANDGAGPAAAVAAIGMAGMKTLAGGAIGKAVGGTRAILGKAGATARERLSSRRSGGETMQKVKDAKSNRYGENSGNSISNRGGE